MSTQRVGVAVDHLARREFPFDEVLDPGALGNGVHLVVLGAPGFESDRRAAVALCDDVTEAGPGLDLRAVGDRGEFVRRQTALEDGVGTESGTQRHRAGDAEARAHRQVGRTPYFGGHAQRVERPFDGLHRDVVAVKDDARFLGPTDRDGHAVGEHESGTGRASDRRVVVPFDGEKTRHVSRDEHLRDVGHAGESRAAL